MPVSLRSAMVARTAVENTSAPPPGSDVSPGSLELDQDVPHWRCFSIRARCAISTAVQRLDVDVGMTLPLSPANHVGVVAQLELRVKPTSNVEFLHGRAADGLCCLVIDLFERPGVVPFLLRHPGK